MTRKSYPDDCECNARDRRTCQQACKPTRTAAHRKHIKENRGGRDDRPAGTPGATKLYSRAEELGFTKRRTKYPLGKPLVVAMTEGRIAANAEHILDSVERATGRPSEAARKRAAAVAAYRGAARAANAKAEAERAAAEKWRKISGLIFIHPCDFTIGRSVHWHRAGKILHGTVVGIFVENMIRPAKVLRRGPVRYHYTPSVYDYCDADGNKPTTWRPPGDDSDAPARVTPYSVKPTKDQLAEAREWNRWAGGCIPNGPAAGSLKFGTCVGTGDLDLATALVLRRVREGGKPT